MGTSRRNTNHSVGTTPEKKSARTKRGREDVSSNPKRRERSDVSKQRPKIEGHNAIINGDPRFKRPPMVPIEWAILTREKVVIVETQTAYEAWRQSHIGVAFASCIVMPLEELNEKLGELGKKRQASQSSTRTCVNPKCNCQRR